MKKITRVDMFKNLDAVIKFWEWADTQPPKNKTRADMVRLLAQYKKADMYIDAHPEHVEHKLVQGFKTARLRFTKGENK